jgi:hypothetical protein
MSPFEKAREAYVFPDSRKGKTARKFFEENLG